MTYINLTDEEVAEIVAKIGTEVNDPLKGLLVVSLSGIIIAELVEATDRKREKKEIDKKTVETIKAGSWTIVFEKTPSNKTHLLMMFRDNCRVDRVFGDKHEALCCAFNILLS